MFGPMQSLPGQPPFLAPQGLGQLMLQLAGGQPMGSTPMPPSLGLPGQNQVPQMPNPMAPAHPTLKMMEGGDPSLPPMMWLPEEPMGANPEMQVFGQQPGNFTGAGPQAAAPQESVWSRLANNLQSDKALQLGLLTIGLNMLQPHSPQQSTLGHIASAVGQGVNTIGNIRQQDREFALKERQIGQGDRRLDITESGQNRQLEQGDRRIDLDSQRVGLEGRRVDTQEAVAGSQLATDAQKREQSAATFPKLQQKLQSEIDRLQTQGAVDEANASLLREKAKAFPQEVRIGLMNAQSQRMSAEASRQNAQTSARRTELAAEEAAKGPKELQVMNHVAEAMVKSGKAKTFEDAISQLGVKPSAGGATAARIQETNRFRENWLAANPKAEGESDQSYEQRRAAAELSFMSTKRSEGYLEGLMAARNSALPGEEEAAMEAYRQEYKKVHGSIPGENRQGASGSSTKRSIPMARVRETAKNRNMTETQVMEAIRRQLGDQVEFVN